MNTVVKSTAMIGKRALEDVRIVDLTDESAIYCTRLFADLGADVVRVVTPDDPACVAAATTEAQQQYDAFFTFMNINKSIRHLDPATPEGRGAVVDLLSAADVVVETWGEDRFARFEIDRTELRRVNPSLVWTRVTPFGSTGPRADWQADDLVAQAMGGLMRLSGAPDREPLRLFGNQSCYMVSLHAATATLMGVLFSEASGIGQDIDVSVQDCIAHTLENAIQFYDSEKKVRERSGGSPEAGVGLFKCKDGLVYLYASAWMMRASWHGIVAWMEERGVEGATEYRDARWLDMAFRSTPEALSRLRTSIEALMAHYTKKQFYEESQRRKVLSAPLNTVPDLLQNPQLSYYDWYRTLDLPDGRVGILTGPPVRMSETPAALRHVVMTSANRAEGETS